MGPLKHGPSDGKGARNGFQRKPGSLESMEKIVQLTEVEARARTFSAELDLTDCSSSKGEDS